MMSYIYLLNQMRVIKVHHTDNNMYVLLEDTPPELISIYKALQNNVAQKI